MKTFEEIENMIPPEVTGVIGCAEYNKRRAEALRIIQARSTMAERALGNMARDDYKTELAAKRTFDDALTVFTKAAKSLHEEYRRLLCIPLEGMSAAEIAWNSGKLMAPGDSPEAQKHNRRVADFSNRRLTALRDLQGRASQASVAFSLASIEGTATDSLLRAKNRAAAVLAAASKPFIAEYQKLQAEHQHFGK